MNSEAFIGKNSTGSTPGPETQNNFDLIRLFAAFQVALYHIIGHIHGEHSAVLNLLATVPGVPVFFFVSGFLIPRSFEKLQSRDQHVFEFFRNRFLRLFPALWVCFILSIIGVWLTGYFASTDVTVGQLGIWALAQNTFVQFYNPDFMRGFGTGVLNGSLWSISVELQFYILTPALVLLCRNSVLAIGGLVGVFGFLNLLGSVGLQEGSALAKLWGVTFAPWFYMFLLGYLFAKWDQLHDRISATPVSIFLLLYGISYLAIHGTQGVTNEINPISLFFLSCTVLKFAYWNTHLTKRLLRGSDISYGLYIYHMPIVNGILYLSLTWPAAVKMGLALFLSLLCAKLSWLWVEKPALAHKKYSMRKPTS